MPLEQENALIENVAALKKAVEDLTERLAEAEDNLSDLAKNSHCHYDDWGARI